jgi:hypothetical protein
MQANDPDQTTVIEMPEPVRRPWQRRRYQVAAGAGLVAVLAAGALAARSAGQTGEPAETTYGRALASTSPLVSLGVPSPSPMPSPTESPIPTIRPLAPRPALTVSPSVSNSGTLAKDHHTLRVVTARADLTGQRELAWAADAGRQVGTSRCTQNFRFSTDTPPRVRPTMMLCWRTSATKTVYAIVVDIDKRPSERETVQIINRVWAQMG